MGDKTEDEWQSDALIVSVTALHLHPDEHLDIAA